MRFFQFPAILFYVIILLSVQNIAVAQQSPGMTDRIRDLEKGKPVERAIAAADTHYYRLTLKAGQFLRALVDQRGIDLIIIVYAPDGQKILEMDSPNGIQGPEPIALEAKTSGPYLIEVRPLEKNVTPGRYEARIEEILTAEQYSAFLAAERIKLNAVKQWLPTNAIPLRTVEAGNGFADMQPLKKLIGGAHLVALGEATHGTREFFQLKHRMLEFLVSEMGFTVFGIEATMPEAFDINEYVLTGNGDPVKALAGLYFWTWNTEEVLEMIQWMRRYNADPRHESKLKFYGFDMQYLPRAVRVTLDYLRKVDPQEADVMEKVHGSMINPYTANDIWNQSQGKKESLASSIKTMVQRFDERKQDYIRRTSVMEYTLTHQHARIMAQYTEMVSLSSMVGSNVRDSSMAENIRWILEQEGLGTKMVIWAHNDHVATERGWMGAHLRQKFGSDMVVFGFAFNQGSFQARDIDALGKLRPFTVGPAPEGSIDAVLAAAGLRLAAINFHALPKDGPVAEWFNEFHTTRSLGSGYSEQSASGSFVKQAVTRRYDALLFVEKTSSARPNEGGRLPKEQKLDTPSNLDFEDGEPGKPPPDWVLPRGFYNFDFYITVSEGRPRTGKHCAMISRATGKHYGETFGSLQQQIDATAYRGKKIKLRAAVRTEVAGPGNQAYLWLRVVKKGFAVAFENKMADRPITHSEWRNYEIAADVPTDAETINYGLALVGDGRAWLDAVSIDVVDN